MHKRVAAITTIRWRQSSQANGKPPIPSRQETSQMPYQVHYLSHRIPQTDEAHLLDKLRLYSRSGSGQIASSEHGVTELLGDLDALG
jgi:hypothetical protein